MKPSFQGALLGAAAGFAAVLAVNLFTFFSPVVIALLFPGKIFINLSSRTGPFGKMLFDTLAYFANILLYAAAGFALGWLLEPKKKT